MKILLLLINFAYFAASSAESVSLRDSCGDAREDTLLNRLRQLERKVSEQYEWRNNLQQKFIEIESIIKSSGIAPLVKCTQATLKPCTTPGVAEINLGAAQSPTIVLCQPDQWLVVLQRSSAAVPFHTKNWQAYKAGFGNVKPQGDFFLGLQNLHEITKTGPYELLIELEDFEGAKRNAQYSAFSVGDEQSNFKLGSLGVYSGTAGDSFKYHEGQSFSTLDRDNDAKAIGSCGELYNSAGWFKSCMEANLFGRYFNGEHTNLKEGIYWETFRGPEYSLKSVRVSIRAKC